MTRKIAGPVGQFIVIRRMDTMTLHRCAFTRVAAGVADDRVIRTLLSCVVHLGTDEPDRTGGGGTLIDLFPIHDFSVGVNINPSTSRHVYLIQRGQ